MTLTTVATTRLAVGRADSLWGRGLDALFPVVSISPSGRKERNPSAGIPWPAAGRRIDEPLYDNDLVQEALKRKQLVEVDPRNLYSIQSGLSLDGMRYYMGDTYARTGETFADRDRPTNRFPIVYHRRRNNQYVLLTGNHRAAAALLKGEMLRAILVEEPEGYGQHTGHHDAVRRRPAYALRGGSGDLGQGGSEGHRGWPYCGVAGGRVGRGGSGPEDLRRQAGDRPYPEVRQDRLSALGTYGPDVILRGLSWEVPDGSRGWALAQKLVHHTITAAEIIHELEPLGIWWGLTEQYGGLSEYESHAEQSWDPVTDLVRQAEEEAEEYQKEDPNKPPPGYIAPLQMWKDNIERHNTPEKNWSGGTCAVVLVAKRPMVQTPNGPELWDPDKHNEPGDFLSGNSYLPSGHKLEIVEVRYDCGDGYHSLSGSGISAMANRPEDEAREVYDAEAALPNPVRMRAVNDDEAAEIASKAVGEKVYLLRSNQSMGLEPGRHIFGMWLDGSPVIVAPPGYPLSEYEVYHEAAHLMVDRDGSKGHGSEFRQTYLNIAPERIRRGLQTLASTHLWWRCQDKGRPFGAADATSRPFGSSPGDELEQDGYSCMVGPWELWAYWADSKVDWVLDDDVISFSGRQVGSIGFEAIAEPDMQVVQRRSWAEFEQMLLHTPVPDRVDVNTRANSWRDVASMMLQQNPNSAPAKMLLGQKAANRLEDVAQAAKDAIDIAMDNWRPTKGMYAYGKDNLDPRVFTADQQMRPDVRAYILTSLDNYWTPMFGHWQDWAKVYLAGSGASYWWDSDSDLDMMVGVDLDRLRAARPANVEVPDEQIYQHLNKTLMDLRPSMAGYQPDPGDRPMDVTYFVNPGAYDVTSIHPYAAYDITEDHWVVKPPVLPKNWGPDMIPDSTWRRCEQVAREAQYTLSLPEPERTIEGIRLFDWVHEGRRDAYSAYGGGWLDPGQVIYQYLEQRPDGLLRKLYLCKHPEAATAADAIGKTATPGLLRRASLPKTAADNSEGIVIVAIPKADDEVHQIGPEEKHATLIYFGNEAPKAVLASAVEAVSRQYSTFSAKVKDTDELGDDKAQVWMLEKSSLNSIRDALMAQPGVKEIYDAGDFTKYPSFTPHVTIGYPDDDGMDDAVMEQAKGVNGVTFDRLALWYKSEQDEYPLMLRPRALGHLFGGIPAKVAEQQQHDIRLVILDPIDPEKAAEQLLEHADTIGGGEKQALVYPTQRKTVGEWDKALMHDLTKTHGFTMHDHPGDAPKDGFMVSIDQSSEQKMPLVDVTPQRIADYMSVHQQELKDPNNYLGGWVFRGTTFLDISRWVPDEQQAMTLAKANHQLAIYDLSSGQTEMVH